MNHRLQQFLAAENLTQSQFADSIEATRGSVSHVLAGRNKPGFDFIESMARRYPALNLEWLVTGKGRMYKQAVIGDMPEEFADEMPAEKIEVSPVAIPQKEEKIDNNEEFKSVKESKDAHIDHIVVFYDDGTYKEIR